MSPTHPGGTSIKKIASSFRTHSHRRIARAEVCSFFSQSQHALLSVFCYWSKDLQTTLTHFPDSSVHTCVRSCQKTTTAEQIRLLILLCGYRLSENFHQEIVKKITVADEIMLASFVCYQIREFVQQQAAEIDKRCFS